MSECVAGGGGETGRGIGDKCGVRQRKRDLERGQAREKEKGDGDESGNREI